MRIDVSTNGIDTILYGNPEGEWLRVTEAARWPRAAEGNEAADAELRTEYADAVRKALQAADEKGAAVVEAISKAVEQGRIDTPENIRMAAMNLLAFGV